jgi:D-lactate dehydrogenase
MKIAFFDTHDYDRKYFDQQNLQFKHELVYFEPRLTLQTVPLARGFTGVCCFVNDRLDAETLAALAEDGVLRLIALRSTGYNNVDLHEAAHRGLQVVRVPAYSPHAVSEHTVGLILSLNRRIHRAYDRVRDFNFSISGFVGFDLHGKTVGVIGTGRIGAIFARTMRQGFGCKVLAYDRQPDSELLRDQIVDYVDLHELYKKSDVISLHIPLTPATYYLIDDQALALMKSGVLIINTGRGALIDSRALIEHLKSGHIGGAGLDVYEQEEGIFFEDLSNQVIQDDVLARLLSFPNVLVTSHQGFFTREALTDIARTTLQSFSDFEAGRPLRNAIRPEILEKKTG